MEKSKIETPGGPQKKLSPWRVMVALLILGGSVWGVGRRVESWQQAKNKPVLPPYRPWFASYVDVTATPQYAFEQLGGTKQPDVVLSFIVSSPNDPCVPTWGTHFTLDQAGVALDLDRRIARLEQQGGRVAVSFGGQANSELALGCSDPAKLYTAYNAVIQRYKLDTIDLDLEGQSLSDAAASKRRAKVIAKLQKDYRAQGKNLAVWLTLPVSPQGLAPEGTDAVAVMLKNKVDLAGVNAMTMDYGPSRQNQSMLAASESALTETYRQLGILYQQAGVNLMSASVWWKIGVTPMIGQNDFSDEVFTLDDAKALNQFALAKGVGRMSMWSANRDIPCGDNYVNVKVVSDSCSGVTSPTASFGQALGHDFSGDPKLSASLLTVADSKSNTLVVDDPKTSPYQIWQATGAYPKGVKVVWHGNVYEAKWWTKDDLPDNPVLQEWQTPWQLIGPVLPGEKPVTQPTLPEGTYPDWAGQTIYNQGDRVLFDGTPFEAKWWNQGGSPAAAAANPDSSPWLPLTQAQILDILNQLKKTQKTS
jgi:chitinase